MVALAVYPEKRAMVARQRAVFPFEVAAGNYAATQNFARVPAVLNRRGIYPVPLELAQEFPRAEAGSSNTTALPGAIESIAYERPSNRLVVKGWATTPDGRQKPDAVALFLVSSETRLIGFSGPAEHSEAASHHRASTGQDAAGWSIIIPADRLPEEDGRMEAYVIEGRTGKLHRVGKALQWQGRPDAGFKLNLQAP